MGETRFLGRLQLAILRVLWEREEASAAQVRAALAPGRHAPTTIATMLVKLERKGLVTHRTEGRQHVYRALIARDEVRRSMVAEFVERLFPGEPAELVNHLLEGWEIDPGELDRLKQRIAELERDDA